MSQESTGCDRVVEIQTTDPVATGDLSVPIGHYYSSNGLISHNSTLAMHLCKKELLANPQATCWYLDYERSSAKKYVTKMGLLNPIFEPRFQLLDPDTFEDAEEIMENLISNEVNPSIFVIDSVPAMVPALLFDRDPDENSPVALQARKWSELLSKWIKTVAQSGTLVILINQIRAYIATSRFDKGKAIPGVAGSEKETTPGGNAIRFYCSMRLRLQPSRIIKGKYNNPMTGEVEEIPIANVVKATAQKNKVGQPYRSGTFYITYGEGIDIERTMVELASAKGIITKASGYKLELPNGTTINSRSEEGFIQELKTGPHAKECYNYLYEALKWNSAESEISKITGIVEEDYNTGETKTQTMNDEELQIKVSLAKNLPTTIAKAEALGLFQRDRGAYTWKNPDTSIEFRAKHVDSLKTKLKKEDLEVLQRQVDALMKEAETPLKSTEAIVTAQPVTTPTDENQVLKALENINSES